jgi:hypothetical protein
VVAAGVPPPHQHAAGIQPCGDACIVPNDRDAFYTALENREIDVLDLRCEAA